MNEVNKNNKIIVEFAKYLAEPSRFGLYGYIFSVFLPKT